LKRTAIRRRSRLIAVVLSESGNNVDVRFKPYSTGISSGSTLGVASMDGGKGRELGAVSLIVFWRDQSCLQNIVAWTSVPPCGVCNLLEHCRGRSAGANSKCLDCESAWRPEII